jgi:hypothetical protein
LRRSHGARAAPLLAGPQPACISPPPITIITLRKHSRYFPPYVDQPHASGHLHLWKLDAELVAPTITLANLSALWYSKTYCQDEYDIIHPSIHLLGKPWLHPPLILA